MHKFDFCVQVDKFEFSLSNISEIFTSKINTITVSLLKINSLFDIMIVLLL